MKPNLFPLLWRGLGGGLLLLPVAGMAQNGTNSVTAMDCISSSAIYELKASATEFCTGATVTFALSNTTSGMSYQLYRGSEAVMDVLAGTGGAATFTGAFAGAGVYTAQVLAKDAYCAETMTGTYPVVERPLPVAPAMSGGGSQCGGSHTVTATRGSGGTGIRWTDNNSTTASRTVSATGTYYAVTTNSAGCESVSAGVSVTITSTPPAPLLSRSAASTCTGASIKFTASGGSSYAWSCSGFTCSGSGSTQTTPTSAGNYTVTVYAVSDSCQSSFGASQSATIIAPAPSGSPANACGCAGGLINCSGNCMSTCYAVNNNACAWTSLIYSASGAKVCSSQPEFELCSASCASAGYTYFYYECSTLSYSMFYTCYCCNL